MAPGIAFLIPLFIACLALHLVGSYTSLIASHLIFTLPLAVWMMVGFIEAVPVELRLMVGHRGGASVGPAGLAERHRKGRIDHVFPFGLALASVRMSNRRPAYR